MGVPAAVGNGSAVVAPPARPAPAEPRYPDLTKARDRLLTRVQKKLARAERWCLIWSWMNYILGLPAVLLAGVSAWQGFADSAELAAIAAAVSGSLMAASTYLKPRINAERHANAQVALEELLDDIEDADLERLQYSEARDTIHGFKHTFRAIEKQTGFGELPPEPQPG